ncbi:unnamed protein product [Darwinula stevensoni]|uniref:Uncharacterized protein n=1 Tax=Darwinula stevensoni TaxID=69355 RepID=A0A7R8X254_9CRUS|nr:unnamed protein product [Darwinula stevensoni]CAG0881068.1 unnamed protein product [Darwinula stevensoni]
MARNQEFLERHAQESGIANLRCGRFLHLHTDPNPFRCETAGANEVNRRMQSFRTLPPLPPDWPQRMVLGPDTRPGRSSRPLEEPRKVTAWADREAGFYAGEEERKEDRSSSGRQDHGGGERLLPPGGETTVPREAAASLRGKGPEPRSFPKVTFSRAVLCPWVSWDVE